MKSPIRWTVYVRDECSLCETLLGELSQLLGDDISSVEVVDVASDPKLEERYGRRVPVITADGEFVCAYRLDRDRVGAHRMSPRRGR
jgi:predicted thioredoxin/glutaredoxin